MDGSITQSFSDTTKSSSLMNQSRTLSSSIAISTSQSSVLHANPNSTSQNPILPVSNATNFHPSIHPPSDSASLLGYSSSSSRFPVTTPFTSSSCHSFPSSSSSKEERNCSSSITSSSSASDSDYDSAPRTANVTLLPRRCSAEMATQRLNGETDVAMGNDETMTTETRTEDENRLRIRRERNKQAAAKCRQRRVDLTNLLMAETETLDMVGADLQREVDNLVRQKNQLEFIMQAHQTQCRMQVTPSHSAHARSIPQFIKLESSDTSLLRPPSAPCSQASGSTFSMHVGLVGPRCQAQPTGNNSLFNNSPMLMHDPTKSSYGNQMTLMTSPANHMSSTANYMSSSANHMSSSTSLSQASPSNTTSSMTRAMTVTMTLPTTSVEPLMSPTTLDAFGSFDFCALLDEQVGSTPPVINATPSSSSSSISVVHNRGDGVLPMRSTLLDL